VGSGGGAARPGAGEENRREQKEAQAPEYGCLADRAAGRPSVLRCWGWADRGCGRREWSRMRPVGLVGGASGSELFRPPEQRAALKVAPARRGIPCGARAEGSRTGSRHKLASKLARRAPSGGLGERKARGGSIPVTRTGVNRASRANSRRFGRAKEQSSGGTHASSAGYRV
jgi:hypothetical protein